MKPAFKIFLAAIILAALSGCTNALYLVQAAAGHFKVMGNRVPIEKILKKNLLDSAARDKLRMVLELREFASGELGLPANKSYTVYSQIKDDYLGWNVYCTPKFSVEPKTWNFPIAGRVVYHGYFSKKAALKFAGKMKADGLDVYVSPITAYSTLGWYNDPVLSSHLRLDTVRLAGLIIHELAHQQLYLKGNSRFNESFAVCVERAGVLRWLKSSAAIKNSDRDSLVADAFKMWERQDLFNAKMLEGRSRLNDLYRSFPAPDSKINYSRKQKNNYSHKQKNEYSREQEEKMLQKKDSILRELKRELFADRDILLNNAYFVPVNTYYSLLPTFRKMLDRVGGNFPQFYIEAATFGKKIPSKVY